MYKVKSKEGQDSKVGQSRGLTPFIWKTHFPNKPTILQNQLIWGHKLNKRLFLSPPHMGGNEQKYIDEVFKSNYIAQGIIEKDKKV